MIRSLRIWPYLETAILALEFDLFLYILHMMLLSFHGRLALVFWSGFWCGSALAVVLFICLRTQSCVRGVQSWRVDPNCRAASHPRENVLQTLQNSGFQDVAVLNTLMTALWPYIAKGCGVRIKDTVQEIFDGYVMDASRHIGVRAVTLLTFGKVLDQVLCAAKKKVQDKLESLLSRATKRVTLKEVDLGTKPPQITEIRCQGGLDECAMEIEVRWEPEGAGLKLSVDFFGPRDIIQVKNMHLQGTAKLVLKPLREEIPGFGAVLVSLQEAPLVDFHLDCGVQLINDSLNLKKIIKESIESALMELIVWPRRFVFPFIPGQDFSFLESHAVGELKVTLIKVEDIAHTHHVGNVDLFVEIFVHQTKVERSTFKKSSKPAFWNETFTVQVEDPETQKLTLRLSRRSRLSGCLPDKLIGSGKLAIAQFHPGVEMEKEMEMSCGLENPETNEIRGILFLAITYHPYPMGAGPGPDLV